MRGFSQLFVLSPLSDRTLHFRKLRLKLHYASTLLTDPILKLIAHVTLDHAPVRDLLWDWDGVLDEPLC